MASMTGLTEQSHTNHLN